MRKKRFFLFYLLSAIVLGGLTAQEKEPDFFITEEKEDRTKFTNEPISTEQKNDTADITAEMKLDELQKKIDSLLGDVEKLKLQSSFLHFDINGSLKVTWGINFPDNPFGFLSGQNDVKYPIHGFDFENNLNLKLSLNNKYFNKKAGSSDDFAEIDFKFKMKNIKAVPYDYRPTSGDYYEVDAVNQDGEKVKIYFPRNNEDKNKAHLQFGNYEFILEQARLSNLLGIGFFINYSDVTQVNTYYGIDSSVEILKLNHDFLNHKFFNDKNIFFSFDYEDYAPESVIAESMNLWSDDMLTDLQEPHGISLGYEGDISNNFHFLFEGGIASKDGYDAVKYKDETLDYGFFLKSEADIRTNNVFVSPKINFGLAFQTDTKEDKDNTWGTFSFSFDLPVQYKINKTDYVNIRNSFTLNTHFAHTNIALVYSIIPEINVLYNCLNFSLPIQYWFQDRDSKTFGGGFYRVENIEHQVYTQFYEQHIFNLAFVSSFRSNYLFGNTFELKIKNTIQSTLTYSDQEEYFFYDILRFQFDFNEVPFAGSYVVMESVQLFHDFGLGAVHNVRMEEIGQIYDDKRNTTGKYYRIPSEKRWDGGVLFYSKLGLNLNFSPYMSVGLAISTPSFLLSNPDNLIGNQNTYCTIELWSEIRI